MASEVSEATRPVGIVLYGHIGSKSRVLPRLPAGNGSWHVVAPKTRQERERSQRALGSIDKNHAQETAAMKQHEQEAVQ